MDLLSMSKMGAVLIVVIVLLRLLFKKHLPRRAFLVLWLIAALRLLLPFSVSSPVSVYNLTPGIATEITQAAETAQPALLPPATRSESAPVSSAPTQFPFTLVWVSGAILTFVFFGVMHLLSRHEYRTALPAELPALSAWRAGHPLRRKLSIRVSDRISAPLTYGALRPVILLPKSILREGSPQLPFVLEHEYIHIRRLDVLWKLVLVVALCIHWFNPAVWLMFYLANRDLEVSCDEAVIRRLGVTNRHDYAMALLALEDVRSRYTPLCNHFSNSAMRERIGSIMKCKKIKISATILALLLVIGVGAAFATSAVRTNDVSIIDRLSMSHTWANALKTRDGKPRFDMMTPEMQAAFQKEKAEIGAEGTYGIGVSSPWVVDYKIAIGDENDVWITYRTTTSANDYYILQERITFVKQDGVVRVSSSQITVEYLDEALFYQAEDIQKEIDNGNDVWRLEPETVAARFMQKKFGDKNARLIKGWDAASHSLTYLRSDGVQVVLTLYHPYNASERPFWAIKSFRIGDTTTDLTMTSLEP